MKKGMSKGSVSEWLRSRTRNPMGSARRGSNPLAVDFMFSWGFAAFHIMDISRYGILLRFALPQFIQ